MTDLYLAIMVKSLWQLTLFVAALWVLTLLLPRGSAWARYTSWVATSLRLLAPFTVLAAIAAGLHRYPSKGLAMSDGLQAMLVNHLWQSTLFAAVIAGLTLLLRKNSPRVRFTLWFAASMKFLLPFALLAAAGTQIPWHPEHVEQGSAASRILTVAGDVAVPVASSITIPPQAGRIPFNAAPAEEFPVALVLFLAWAAGALFVAERWLMRWWEIRRVLRGSTTQEGMKFPAPVRVTSKPFEPGVVGIIRPVLLLPKGIEERLTPDQMRAVLTHERCHVDWRDNLTASLHMLVETVFWFHPLVWWIGARLIDERERACDEQVVRDGCAPRSYAEGILAVCEHYIASRLPCVSGISGSDLRMRVESILKNTLSLKLDRRKKFLLAAIAGCSLVAPIMAGSLSGSVRQVLFSFSPGAAAKLEYSRLQDAIERQSELQHDRKESDCLVVTDTIIGRQRALAATVSTLSAGDGKNVLLYAVAANSPSDVQRLLAAGAPRNGDRFDDDRATQDFTLMHVAAMHADARMMEALANSGFNPDNPELSVDNRGNTHKGGTPLMNAMVFGRPDNAVWLMQHGADINATTVTDYSPLAAAALCRDQNMIASLLAAGALPNWLALQLANAKGMDLRGSQPWHAAPGERVEVTADFDGDGAADHTRLLVSADGRREGLFVQLSSIDPTGWIHAAEANSRKAPISPMGTSIAAPGVHAKSCAKGYGRPCISSEPAVVTLERPGISFWQEEGASSIVYWDSKARRFEQVWTSD